MGALSRVFKLATKNQKRTEKASAAQKTVSDSRVAAAVDGVLSTGALTMSGVAYMTDRQKQEIARMAEEIKKATAGSAEKDKLIGRLQDKVATVNKKAKEAKPKVTAKETTPTPAPKPKQKAPKKDRVLSSTDASTARSYNKGGYANCGASVPGTQKRK